MSGLDRFILGTVQLGLSYGINNQTGKPVLAESQKILKRAEALGVKTMDTADGYGDSSEVIASLPDLRVDILTKFIVNEKYKNFDTALAESLRRLGRKKILCYSFHRFQDFADFKEWSAVEKNREAGLFKYLGVSIYSNEEGFAAIASPHVNLIQMPFNVLDNWKERGAFIEAAKKAGKIVHVRSVFLQGLFFKKASELTGNLKELAPALERLQQIAGQAGLSVYDLCLQYVLSNSMIDGLVIGVETVQQLEKNISALDYSGDLKSLKGLIEDISVSNRDLLNPSKWKP